MPQSNLASSWCPVCEDDGEESEMLASSPGDDTFLASPSIASPSVHEHNIMSRMVDVQDNTIRELEEEIAESHLCLHASQLREQATNL